MKKLILSVTAIAGLAMAGSAQQVYLHDDNAAAPTSNDVSINGVISTGDLNLELLVGGTAGTVTTDVVTLLLSQATSTATTGLGSVQSAQGDVSALGLIADQSNNGYQVAGGTDFYQILAWTGNYSSYAAALASGQTGVDAGETAVLQFDLNSTPAVGAPPADEDLASPLNLTQVTSIVPEPSTMAMAGVGLASMLIFRRRNK
jgi:hypothetical protein